MEMIVKRFTENIWQIMTPDSVTQGQFIEGIPLVLRRVGGEDGHNVYINAFHDTNSAIITFNENEINCVPETYRI